MIADIEYTAKEIKENRQKWLDALRSGKYTQVFRRIRRDGKGFCSMGVGCDVSRIYTWIRDRRVVTDKGSNLMVIEYEDNVWTYGEEYLIMPVEVKEFYGVDPAWHFSSNMVLLNDGLRLDFPTIAQSLGKMFKEYDAGNWDYHEPRI